MLHRNAPLSPEGRLRLVQRCQNRPIAHVAAEMGISRACASKWVNRYRQHGELGLLDRSSAPRHQPTATRSDVVARIEALRRAEKWSAARIAVELQAEGVSLSRRTVSGHLQSLGLNRRRFIDPSGDTNREPRKITARRPGHMVHIERIVTDNGACYRAGAFARALLGARHQGADQRITPYTPCHNGKVERYNRIIAEEFLHARSRLSEGQRRDALDVGTSTTTTTDLTVRQEVNHQPGGYAQA